MRRLHRPFELLELAVAIAPGFNGTAEQFGPYIEEILDEVMSGAGLNGRCERCLGSACLKRKDGQLTDCPYCLGGYEIAQQKTREELWSADAETAKAEIL